ncbi:MAG: DUF2478 domain-containing protein [Hyphomicrobiales bacterium]|nr:DUF2478 domain-containing protein [Hyphomicrobiales bacterium]
MKIACVTLPERGATDHILTEIAEELQAMGRKLIGIVKVSEYQSSFANGCDMVVRVLPEGPEIKITQNLGKGSDACRLDPGAISEAVTKVETGPMESADLFILNKFGPEEAAGRGFCATIGAALEHDIPVLIGVGEGSKEAFAHFAGAFHVITLVDKQAIFDWLQATSLINTTTLEQ